MSVFKELTDSFLRLSFYPLPGIATLIKQVTRTAPPFVTGTQHPHDNKARISDGQSNEMPTDIESDGTHEKNDRIRLVERKKSRVFYEIVVYMSFCVSGTLS